MDKPKDVWARATFMFRVNFEVGEYYKRHGDFNGVRKAVCDKLYSVDDSGEIPIFHYLSTPAEFSQTIDKGGIDGILDSIIEMHKANAYNELMEQKSISSQEDNGAPKITLEEISLRDAEYTKSFDDWKNKKFGGAVATA